MALSVLHAQQDHLDEVADLSGRPCCIEVRPSAKGMATIYDKEIVLYIASLMAGKI